MANGDEDKGLRAAVKSRRAGVGGYDVGLHAQDELGTFDVGLAIEGVPGAGESLGFFVQAPRVGSLRVAFAVTAEGVTRLAALERRDEDGVPLPTAGMIAIDEGRTLRLEAQVARYELAIAFVESERNEARDRAAALGDEKKELKENFKDELADLDQARREALEELAIARSELAREKEQRAEALAGRETAREQLTQAGEELEALKAHAEQAKTQAALELEARLAVAETDQQREVSRLEAKLAASEADLQREVSQLEEKLTAAADAVNEEKSKRSVAEAGHGAAEGLRDELAKIQAELLALEQSTSAASEELQGKLAAFEEGAHAAAEAQRAEVSSLEAKITEAEEAARTAQTAMDSLKEEISDLQGKLESDAGAAKTLAHGVSELEARLAAAEEAAREEKVVLQSRLEVAEAEGAAARALSDELAGLKEKLSADLQTQNSGSEAQSEAARNVQALLKAKLAAVEEAARNEQSLLHAKLEAAEEAARNEQSLLQAKLEAVEEALRGEQARVQQSEEAGSELQARARSAEQAVSSMQSELQAAEQSASDLRARLEAAEQQGNATVGVQRNALDEARNLARQLQAAAARLTTERDEARNVARTLHQRAGAGGTEVEGARVELKQMRESLGEERQIASQLVTDKQRLQMQIDSLSRQLDTERNARARLATERGIDFAHEDTRPHEIESIQATQPGVPGPVLPPEWGEDQTQPGKSFPSRKSPAVKTQPMGAPSPPTKKGK